MRARTSRLKGPRLLIAGFALCRPSSLLEVSSSGDVCLRHLIRALYEYRLSYTAVHTHEVPGLRAFIFAGLLVIRTNLQCMSDGDTEILPTSHLTTSIRCAVQFEFAAVWFLIQRTLQRVSFLLWHTAATLSAGKKLAQ